MIIKRGHGVQCLLLFWATWVKISQVPDGHACARTNSGATDNDGGTQGSSRLSIVGDGRVQTKASRLRSLDGLPLGSTTQRFLLSSCCSSVLIASNVVSSPLNDDVGTPLNDDDMNGMQTKDIYCHRQVPRRVETPVAAARFKNVKPKGSNRKEQRRLRT